MIDNDDKYLEHFEIISLAGGARSSVMEALVEAQSGQNKEALENITQARKNLVEAHTKMFSMLQKEANGSPVEMNIVAVHAQNHIAMATVMIDLGELIIHLIKRVDDNEIVLKKGVSKEE